jgi:hypothetical protein
VDADVAENLGTDIHGTELGAEAGRPCVCAGCCVCMRTGSCVCEIFYIYFAFIFEK